MSEFEAGESEDTQAASTERYRKSEGVVSGKERTQLSGAIDILFTRRPVINITRMGRPLRRYVGSQSGQTETQAQVLCLDAQRAWPDAGKHNHPWEHPSGG